MWRNQPVTPSFMNQRIDKAAIDYAVYAPVPRIVLYDIGFPDDQQEYKALDGNAVILLTAISQEREELPLQRVYVSDGAQQVELKLLKLVLAELPGTDNASKTFGRFRADALYLFPMSLRVKDADLIVDFQRNRAGFKIASLNTALPDDISRMMVVKPTGAGPSQSVLETFIKREYPTFFP